MADLGNLFFSLGLKSDEFDKKLESEKRKALEISKELNDALANFGNISASTGKAASNSDEKRKQTLLSLTAQMNKLAEAEQKVTFAAQHSNAAGLFSQQALKNIQAAKVAIQQLQANVSNGSVPRSSIQSVMEQAVRSIREANTAISQQKVLNAENSSNLSSGHRQMIENIRRINRGYSDGNGQLSITRRLIGEIGSYAGMYFSIFTAGSLLSSLVRIRGEFDMQYISLKAILQSGEQATKLFEQIKGLAVISPFKFMDLTTYAKQLSAYQIPTNELFDTTKRLADLSSGLGVGMDRIILAYGQVRSAAFLRGQELRQFTEAGIPMVDELANKFTKLTGKVTTAGDVFSKITKREVPFQMVKEVIDSLTSEGGKFYNMQEKQAESLKGKVSNLADQYDLMMNRIGESNDKTLKNGVDMLNSLMQHSDDFIRIAKSLISVYGLYRLAVWAHTAAMGSNLNALTAEESKERIRMARLSEEAQLYRQLTMQERLYLSQHKTSLLSGFDGSAGLNSGELRQMYVNGRISQNEVLRLAFMGRINEKDMEHLVLQKRITAEQSAQTLKARANYMAISQKIPLLTSVLGTEKATNMVISARIAMMRIGQSFMGAFASIVNPATLLLIGGTAILDLIQKEHAQSEKIRNDASQLSTDMKEEWNDIQKFISDHPIEIAIKGGNGSISEYIKQYEDELLKVLPESTANAQIAMIPFGADGKQLPLDEQLTKAKSLLEAAKQAKSIIQENATAFADAANSTNGIFSDGLLKNFDQLTQSIGDWRSALANLGREDVLKNLSNPMPKVADWMKQNAADAGKLNAALKDTHVSMQSIYNMVLGMNKKSGIGLVDALGFSDVAVSMGKISNPDTGRLKDAMDDMGKMVDDFKKRLADKNIDWASAQGKDVAETFKQKFFEQNSITGQNDQMLFSFMFDEKMYGKSDAAFSMLAQEMRSLADSNLREAVNQFIQDGIWSDGMVKAIEDSKNSCIAKFPMIKSELLNSWNVSVPQLKVMISTALSAQKLEAWQQELLDITGGEYSVQIKSSTNLDEALKSIESVYKAGKQFMQDQKPLMIQIGYSFGNGKTWVDKNAGKAGGFNYLTGKWEGANNSVEYSLAQTYSEYEKQGTAFQKLLDRKLVQDPKLKGEGTNKKDEYTESLKRRYETTKKAIQDYNNLLKSMGTEAAMEQIRKIYGLPIEARYLATDGAVSLASDYMRKNIKKSDAGKSFAETLKSDRMASMTENYRTPYDAAADAILNGTKISEDQYKVYDEIFSKIGNARMAAIMAFGTDTKPYNTLVELMKARFSEMAAKMKVAGGNFSFDDALELSEEERKKLPEKLQTLFNSIQEKSGSEFAELKKKFADAFAGTDDNDIQIAINENLRKSLLDGLKNIMTGADEGQIEEARKAINSHFDKIIEGVKIDKLKKNIDWEELFGNIGSLTLNSLKLLEKQLEAIINSSTDTKKMREFVTKLQEVKDAEAKLEPLDDIFGNYKDAVKAKKSLDNIEKAVTDINSLKYGESTLGNAYAAAIAGQDASTQKMIEQTNVTVSLRDETGKLVEQTLTYKQLLEKLHIIQKDSSQKTDTFMSQFQATGFSNSGIGKLISMKAGGGSNGAGGVGTLAIIDTIIQGVHTNISALSDIMKDWNIKADSEFGQFANKLQNLDKFAYGGWEKLKGGNVMGAISDVIQSWGAIIDLFSSDTEAQYQKDLASHEKLVSVWEDLINLKKEYLQTGYTEDIKQSESELKKLYELEAASARIMGKEYLNAGAATFKHSHGVNQKSNITDEAWQQLAQWRNANKISSDLYSSITGGRMTGLFDLSLEQLQKLKEEAPLFFSQLDDDTQKYLNNIMTSEKAKSEALDEIKQKLTSTTVDELTSGYASALDSMNDMTNTFSNNFTKTLRTAIINAFLNSDQIKKKIQSFYDKLYSYLQNNEKGANGSELSESEISDLKKDWQAINDEAKTAQETYKQLGLYADQNATSLSGAIKGITEETADILASYTNAIRADVSQIRNIAMANNTSILQTFDVIVEYSQRLAEIAANTKLTAENTGRNADTVNRIANDLSSMMMVTSKGKALRT